MPCSTGFSRSDSCRPHRPCARPNDCSRLPAGYGIGLLGFWSMQRAINSQHEPSDDMFKRVEQLTPAELSKNLSRVYIYNMNSAFR